DFRQGEVFLILEGLLELAVELARAVGAFDLAVAEEVALGQELVAEQVDAVPVVLAPVVAVGEMEHVDVPLHLAVLIVDDLMAGVVSRGEPGAAALAGVVEGVLVDLAGDRVVDDVAGGHAVVLALEPGVDPEGLGADDLLLVVGHRARDVHQVEDHGVELGERDRVPGPVELILADRDDQRLLGVVGVGGDLPLEGLLVGALEVAEALRPGLADPGVAVFLLGDVGAALGLDPGQGELLAGDLGQLVHGQLDLEDVMAGRVAGAAAGLAVTGAADRRAHVAGTLADPAAVLGPVAELGDLDLRQRDRHVLAAGLADHLAVRDVFPQVGLDLASDDLLEPIGVTINFANHGCETLAAGFGGRGTANARSPRNWPPPARMRSRSPSGLSGPPGRKSKDRVGKTRLGTVLRGGSSTIRIALVRLLVPATQDNPTANCIPSPLERPRPMRGRFPFSTATNSA